MYHKPRGAGEDGTYIVKSTATKKTTVLDRAKNGDINGLWGTRRKERERVRAKHASLSVDAET